MTKKIGSILLIALTSCAPNKQNETALRSIADTSINSLACEDFQMKVWDGIKEYLIQQQQIPLAYDLNIQIKKQLEILRSQHFEITKAQISQLEMDFEILFKAILEESPQGESAQTPEQVLILLSAIDVGDKSTPFRKYMVEKTEKLFAQIEDDIRGLKIPCQTPTVQKQEVTSQSFSLKKLEAQQAGIPLSVVGSRWAFKTAYQSCRSNQIPALDTASDDVQGISIVGKHPDGVGNKRLISNLNLVQNTHHYIKNESSYGTSCFNVRSNPLIYDYGGKPYATTAANSAINMFKNNGDGTSVLGIDCSAYVFTSMAAAGLKLKESRPLKASDAWAWGSSSYVEPQKNGLTCLNKIPVTPTESLKAGDIVAVYGHVFLIDSVGSDPFGIGKTKSIADCANMNPKNFDFIIAQSSSGKNGIGINHYQGSAYVAEHPNSGLLKYARYACQSFYNKKSYTPSLGDLSVVRHKGTAACMAPRVKLTNEECIQSCETL